MKFDHHVPLVGTDVDKSFMVMERPRNELRKIGGTDIRIEGLKSASSAQSVPGEKLKTMNDRLCVGKAFC